MKLYNAGSFFDPRAVPDADYDAIAATLAGLSRVVVESHPALVGPRVDRLLAALAREAGGERPIQLEVAMGLETAHPGALDRLNKRFTLEGFRTASAALADRGSRCACFCSFVRHSFHRTSRMTGCCDRSMRRFPAARRRSR